MEATKKIIQTASKWVGYLEKKSNADLDHFTKNAGSKNYTCFARDYKIHTGQNFQAQPWCAMFVSMVMVQAFGLEKAKKLLCGSLYHYCPTGVNQFKAKGRWHKEPKPGDIIFFTNGTRAYHTGLVVSVTNTKVITVEGNTSGGAGVEENGGGVFQKSYLKSYNRILGYGRPDYSMVDSVKKSGWIEEDGGWRFYLGDTGEPVRNDWYQDGDNWYWFDGAGMMVANDWYQYKDSWYYFGGDGAMVTGLQVISGKAYYFDNSGAMATKPVTVKLVPDQDGALH